jgi:hypothetical protein
MERRKFIKAGAATLFVAGLTNKLVASTFQESSPLSFTSSLIDLNGKKYKLSLKFHQQDIHWFKSSESKTIVLEIYDETQTNEFTKVIYKIRNVEKVNDYIGSKYNVEGAFSEAFYIKNSSSGTILSNEKLYSYSKIPNYFKDSIKFVATLNAGTDYTVDLKTSASTTQFLTEDNTYEYDDCFLTSACTISKQLPDNCYELQTLRNFRDEYMKSSNYGNNLVENYYQIAPEIVKKINRLENKKEVYDYMYQTLVLPSLAYIEAGENENAMEYYKEYTEALNELFRD